MKNAIQEPPVAQYPNILPCDGCAVYFGQIYAAEVAMKIFEELLSGIAWKPDEAIMFGKHIFTYRKAAWYADTPVRYTYSRITKQALPWNDLLRSIKQHTETITGEIYNSCLLNLYHNGKEGMAWHSDDEKTLAPEGSIASLTFGAERRFLFKHKETKEKITVSLQNGSLLNMSGLTQHNWWHRLPPSAKITTPRINLTFRQMKQ